MIKKIIIINKMKWKKTFDPKWTYKFGRREDDKDLKKKVTSNSIIYLFKCLKCLTNILLHTIYSFSSKFPGKIIIIIIDEIGCCLLVIFLQF